MPFQERSLMEHRVRFGEAASVDGAHVRARGRAVPISPTTGDTGLARYQADGVTGVVPHSRRPHTSPARPAPAVAAAVIALGQAHPVWGGRTLRGRRARDHPTWDLPSPSPITAIRARHDLLDPLEAAKPRPTKRVAATAPNDWWQMDGKGDFAVGASRCYPLTILAEHARYALAVVACADQQPATVQAQLTAVFRT